MALASITALCALLLLDGPASTPAELLQQVITASKENSRRSVNWLGREDIRRYDLRGKRKLVSWLTYEASKVEGENYYRLIARDGKPLSKKDAQREKLKLERESAFRHSTPVAQRGPSRDTRFSMSLRNILEHHRLQYSGEDVVDGRKIWIVDTRLLDAAPPALAKDEMALLGDATLWIDQETHLICMQEIRMRRQWLNWRPGSIVRYEMAWNGEVMLVKRILVRLETELQENEQIYTDYKKFGAEANVRFEAGTPPH